MQIIFAVEILVIRLAKTWSRDILTSFVVSSVCGYQAGKFICKANRQQNHTTSGIVTNTKVMKNARD